MNAATARYFDLPFTDIHQLRAAANLKLAGGDTGKAFALALSRDLTREEALAILKANPGLPGI